MSSKGPSTLEQIFSVQRLAKNQPLEIKAIMAQSLPISSKYLADLVTSLSIILGAPEVKPLSKFLASIDSKLFPMEVSIPLSYSFQGTLKVTDISFLLKEGHALEIPKDYMMQHETSYSSVHI